MCFVLELISNFCQRHERRFVMPAELFRNSHHNGVLSPVFLRVLKSASPSPFSLLKVPTVQVERYRKVRALEKGVKTVHLSCSLGSSKSWERHCARFFYKSVNVTLKNVENRKLPLEGDHL